MNIIFLAQALSFLIPESNSTEAREYKIELVAKLKKSGLNARKAVVISEHPSSSYRLVEENGLIAYCKSKTRKNSGES